jgi:hypothetical protein
MNDNFEAVVREKTRIPKMVKISVAIVMGACLLGVVSMSYLRQVMFQPAVMSSAEELRQDIVTKSENQPFIYKLVPDAEKIISIDGPVEANESNQIFYDTVKIDEPVTLEMIENKIAFNLPFKDSTYGEYINALDVENRKKIFQMNDELVALTAYINTKYPLTLTTERIKGIALPPEVVLQPAYIPLRAVSAFSAAYQLAKADPDNSDWYYSQSDALVERQISYGLYTKSDADAARNLVVKYTDLLSDTFSGLPTATTSVQ